MLFHIVYATSSKPLFALNRSQEASLNFIILIDAYSKYLSAAFNFFQFDLKLVKIFYNCYKTSTKFCSL